MGSGQLGGEFWSGSGQNLLVMGFYGLREVGVMYLKTGDGRGLRN